MSDGMEKQDIPIIARTVTLADVYDALISKRSYKEAFSENKGCSIIEKVAGGPFRS